MEETAELISHTINGEYHIFEAYYQASIVTEEAYLDRTTLHTRVFPYRCETEAAAVASAMYHIVDEDLPLDTPITVTKSWLKV